jgi:tyrosyl-tRNA synthetase
MLKYFNLLTDEDLSAVKKMHPKEAKVKLAKTIISQYHSKEAAQKEAIEFQRVFSQKEIPGDILEYKTDGAKTIIAILLESGLVKSGNEARRLIKQGAVSFEDNKIEREDFVPKSSGIIKAGSHRFLRITL